MSDRKYLSYDEAVALLPEDETIHVFRNPGVGCLIGADWDRGQVLEALKEHAPELAGEQATAMNHGIVIHDHHGPAFIATKGASK